MNIIKEAEVTYVTEETAHKLLEIARRGILYEDFEELYASAPFSLAQWARILSVSERTLQRYQKSGHCFSTPESEKILKVAHVMYRGREVFGSDAVFHRWLALSSVTLGGQAPETLFDSMIGLDMVLDELGRIEHGVPA